MEFFIAVVVCFAVAGFACTAISYVNKGAQRLFGLLRSPSLTSNERTEETILPSSTPQDLDTPAFIRRKAIQEARRMSSAAPAKASAEDAAEIF